MSRYPTTNSTANKRPAEADSTSSKKAATESTNLMSGSYRQNEEEEGYSLQNNIHHIQSHNPFTRGQTTTVIYTLKNRQFIDFNCCTNGQKPWLLPYKQIKFWIPEKSTQNYKNWYTLMSISHGWNILNLNLKIDNHSITRQRIITQGSTTVVTYDFETSQNLIIGHLLRDIYIHEGSTGTTEYTKPVQTALEFFKLEYDPWT